MTIPVRIDLGTKNVMNSQDDTLNQNIYNVMEQKSTQELLEIWWANDRDEWTDDAFEIIGTILLKRLGFLPKQADIQSEIDDEIEFLHNRSWLVKIAVWSRKLSWIILAIWALLSIFVVVIGVIDEFSSGWFSWYLLAWSIANALINAFSYLLTSLFFFIVLQSVSHGIYILLEIYKNTQPE